MYPSVTCSHNMTPIMFAIYYGLEEEILDFLLEKGAILDESDEDGSVLAFVT